MIPVLSVYQAMAAGIAAMAPFQVATLGIVRPIRSPYTPGIDLEFADLDLSDFDVSTALVQDAVPVIYSDPATGDIIINLEEPAGGWQWITTALTNLPQQVWGYALLNAAGNSLVAVTEPLVDPLTLSAVGEGIDAGPLTFRVPVGGVV